MKWCEIFKVGEHTDSKGNKKLWTVDDLKTIEKNFNEKNRDVPICCGHPKTNSPAYGWVENLKTAGESLYAAYKDVQPEFKEAVKKGLFKTRSISLTPDLVLRHVAFLGGQTPAIKGLEQFCFAEPSADTDIFIDFQESEQKEGDLMDETMQKELDAKDKRIKELEAALEKEKQDKLTKEFEDFCDEAIKKRNILPSEKASVMNVLQACNRETLNFEDSKEKSAEELFKNFINGLTRIDFEETATQKNVINSDNSVDFQSADSIRQGIILIQNEYKQKGIELSAQEALSVLEKKE